MNRSDSSLHAGDLPPIPTRRGRDRELWVGLFLIIGIATIVFLLITLTDPSTFQGRYALDTIVNDASGLRRGDPVQLRGVTVGRVGDFELGPAGVTVRLEVQRRYHVPEGSHVVVKTGGLLGGMIAEIVPGNSPRNLPPGSKLPGEASGQLTETASELAGNVEAVLDRMQSLLSKQTIEGVTSSSTELASLLKDLRATVAEQRKSLGEISANLGKSSGNLERATGPQLQRSIQQMDRATASLERILGQIDRGEGTLGKLTKDETLYKSATASLQNLNGAAAELRALINDVRRNPGRYFHFSVL